MTAHRWNVPVKPPEVPEQHFFTALPSEGKVVCIRENTHGFEKGKTYSFTASLWADYFPPSHNIIVAGERSVRVDWVFPYNDEMFHSYFKVKL